MPLFEYRCGACGRRYRVLLGVTSDASAEACPDCGGAGTQLISRFRRGRSEDDRLDEIADRLDAFGEPESASGMRETVRELGKAMDEDVSDELEELLDDDLAGSVDEPI